MAQESGEYFVHESSYVDEGCTIGKGTKIWHFSHIMSDCRIGENCNIGQNVVVSPGVVLGNNVKIQNNVSVYTGVECGDDVFLGPSCVFTNVINPRSAVSRKNEYRKTLVGRGASIGANATIVCGHNIGEYALIGAGSVVTRDVPAFALMVGNPARQQGWISRNGAKLIFHSDSSETASSAASASSVQYATCPQTGERYRLEDGQVSLA
ncbi:MAG: N-acetyltransferase [Bacteroidales bacterium]|nr:N-acetyltransferase [Candidatus Egerieousia equi]